jgi:hypothetical protein
VVSKKGLETPPRAILGLSRSWFQLSSRYDKGLQTVLIGQLQIGKRY